MPVTGRTLGSFKLPVQVGSYDGLSWSPDNQLGIITRKGVYVFEVTPDVETAGPGLHCIKTIVSNETGLESWHLEGVLSEEELAGLEREDRSEVMMDRILSPHMAAGEVTFKQPSKVRYFITLHFYVCFAIQSYADRLDPSQHKWAVFTSAYSDSG